MTVHSKRIAQCFYRLRVARRAALIPYIVARDPTPDCSAPLMHALVAGGADLVELGIPFSDPEAEGVDIQHAFERALAHNTTLADVLDDVADFRRTDQATPIVLMGYLNPIERMGYADFVATAESAGVDAVLVVNMPPEEAADLQAAVNGANMDVIYLLAPTTRDERVTYIDTHGSGFLYYVSLKGITGAGHLDLKVAQGRFERLRNLVSIPMVMGFGIRDADTAEAVARFADGVVVGSEFARRIASLARSPDHIATELKDFTRLLRQAIDRARHG